MTIGRLPSTRPLVQIYQPNIADSRRVTKVVSEQASALRGEILLAKSPIGPKRLSTLVTAALSYSSAADEALKSVKNVKDRRLLATTAVSQGQVIFEELRQLHPQISASVRNALLDGITKLAQKYDVPI